MKQLSVSSIRKKEQYSPGVFERAKNMLERASLRTSLLLRTALVFTFVLAAPLPVIADGANAFNDSSATIFRNPAVITTRPSQTTVTVSSKGNNTSVSTSVTASNKNIGIGVMQTVGSVKETRVLIGGKIPLDDVGTLRVGGGVNSNGSTTRLEGETILDLKDAPISIGSLWTNGGWRGSVNVGLNDIGLNGVVASYAHSQQGNKHSDSWGLDWNVSNEVTLFGGSNNNGKQASAGVVLKPNSDLLLRLGVTNDDPGTGVNFRVDLKF
ncbi:hypothetical protein HY570_03840 [Candidatus Micrarchaeota archaeon]|nr:hypothetical protein [Candidatus Micrarchaeota archaeon]